MSSIDSSFYFSFFGAKLKNRVIASMFFSSNEKNGNMYGDGQSRSPLGFGPAFEFEV